MLMKYKDFKMLSIDDMKQILGGNMGEDGGGTCRSHCKQGSVVFVSDCVSKATAQEASDDCNQTWGSGSGGWCCASCGSAGWGSCS